MPTKLYSFIIFPSIIFISLVFLFLYSTFYTNNSSSSLQTKRFLPSSPSSSSSSCDLFKGQWVLDTTKPKPFYDETCPFHRNAWNCLKNKRDNMGIINSWKWVPKDCSLERIDPWRFLGLMRNRNIGFVGDSLNENFLVFFSVFLEWLTWMLGKWKKKFAWRGAYFPKYNVMVAYHRAVLLAKYKWKPKQSTVSDQDGLKGIYRVDVDIPADEWISITDFYDVLVFNTGHCNNGVNKEARKLNHLIKEALQGTDIQLLDLTHLSEFRADAHPAIWLGKKDAASIWGQDCMHWCLPGVPDTWVDILVQLILSSLETG
ncbi:hypothetical protein PTKIN_Ptkin02bG0232900 [Pterospermum kingtungense]